MNWVEGKEGRVFVLRLEDGEVLHEEVERFAREHDVLAATVLAVGGADKGSALVVGPEDGCAEVVRPMRIELSDIHEAVGFGTIFPDDNGEPVLHMHMACGRGNDAVAGCVRAGVRTWLVLEIVIREIVADGAVRRKEPETGFKLLSLERDG